MLPHNGQMSTLALIAEGLHHGQQEMAPKMRADKQQWMLDACK